MNGSSAIAPSSNSASPLLEISVTNKLFVQATKYTIFSWCVLISALYSVTPTQDLVYLSDSERSAAAAAFFCLMTATCLMIMPFVVQGRVGHIGPLLWAAISCQTIAVITNGLLAFCPVVVRIDAVTYSPVYLVRWCEWIPLSGLMTFLCEGVAIKRSSDNYKEKHDLLIAVWTSLIQSLSCLAGGLICAYCENVYWWAFFISVSIVAWLCIFPRVLQKRRDYLNISILRKPAGAFNHGNMQKEKRDRLRFSYHLMLTCSVVWSTLVLMYCVNAYIYRVLPENHDWKGRAPAMIADTIFDVLAKAFYMRCIVDVHFAVFDKESRAMRRLAELRSLMTILWDTSSDVIVVSIKEDSGKLVSILSPAFLNLLGVQLPESVQGRFGTGLMVETSPTIFTEGHYPQKVESWGEITKSQYVDTADAPYRGWINHTILEKLETTSFAARAASRFVAATWERSSMLQPDKQEGTTPSTQNLRPYSVVTESGDDRKTEIKVSNYGQGAIIGVIRDVTERFRWFEAERRAQAEVIRRQQDAQSQTRFVRHEVKNGLLAGIELCDSLRNEIDAIRPSYRLTNLADGPIRRRSSLLDQSITLLSMGESSKNDPPQRNDSLPVVDSTIPSVPQYDSERSCSFSESDEGFCFHTFAASQRVMDLDLLLHEVLETVLHEAMARDVIHEVYQPRVERLDVVSVLSSSVSTKSGKSDRFPIRCDGEVPFLQMDSQLLRYIHRNAISNATKYGKIGGKVDTIVSYDTSKKMLTMKVVNESGDNQNDSLKLSKEEYNRIVFSQGTTLHGSDNASSAISSGDGAWIMQKCAKTMGGLCSITFNDDETIFAFEAPVEPLLISTEMDDAKDFVVPESTIGVAIDDSKIQRKLLARILSYTGVSSKNIHVIGERPEEVMRLPEMVTKLLNDNPDSKILLLMDENLDYGIASGNTTSSKSDVVLSGSLVLQGMLKSMPPVQEKRVLALVRSANDSTTDVACYIERTHGFFPKAPMQKERVREIIAPLWAGKFLSSTSSSCC